MKSTITVLSLMGLAAASLNAASFEVVLQAPEDIGHPSYYQGTFTSFVEGDGVLAVGGSILARDEENQNVNYIVHTSTDGETFTPAAQAPAMNTGLYSGTYGGGKFVFGGATGQGTTTSIPSYYAVSSDGVTWEQDQFHEVEASGDFAIQGMAYGDGTYVGVANAGTVYTSSNGTEWTLINEGADFLATVGVDLSGAIYQGGKFVLAGAGGVATTADFSSWVTGLSTGIYNPTLAYGDGIYVSAGMTSVGQAMLGSSTDLESWETYSPGAGTPYVDLAYGNGYFVAVVGAAFSTPAISYSSDGVNWTTLDMTEDLGGARITAVGYAMGSWYVATQASGSAFDPRIWKATEEFPPQVGGGGPVGKLFEGFKGMVELNGGWYWDDNVGYAYPLGDTPWAYTYAAGWIYAMGNYDPYFYFYQFSTGGWFFTNVSYKGNVFSYSQNAWLKYDYDSQTYITE